MRRGPNSLMEAKAPQWLSQGVTVLRAIVLGSPLQTDKIHGQERVRLYRVRIDAVDAQPPSVYPRCVSNGIRRIELTLRICLAPMLLRKQL